MEKEVGQEGNDEILGLLGILNHKLTEKENEVGMEVGREIASLYIHTRGHIASERGRQRKRRREEDTERAP